MTYPFDKWKPPPRYSLVAELICAVAVFALVVYIVFSWLVKKSEEAYVAGRYAEVVKKLKLPSILAPLDTGIFFMLAKTHAKLGHHEEAVAYYQKLMELKQPEGPQLSSGLTKPDLYSVYYGLAYEYFDLKQFDDVIVFCQNVLYLNPKDTGAYKLLAVTYYKKSLRRNDRQGFLMALKYLKKAEDLDPAGVTGEEKNFLEKVQKKVAASEEKPFYHYRSLR